MKSIKWLVLALLPFISAAALANNAMPENLVGKWKYDGSAGGFPETMALNNDASYEIQGLMTRLKVKTPEACLVTIKGIMAVSQTAKDKVSITSQSAIVTLNSPAPGTTLAQCNDMVSSLNQMPDLYIADVVMIDASTIQSQALGGDGNLVTFKRYFG